MLWDHQGEGSQALCVKAREILVEDSSMQRRGLSSHSMWQDPWTSLWPLGAVRVGGNFPETNYLFTGDIVDRGYYGIIERSSFCWTLRFVILTASPWSQATMRATRPPRSTALMMTARVNMAWWLCSSTALRSLTTTACWPSSMIRPLHAQRPLPIHVDPGPDPEGWPKVRDASWLAHEWPAQVWPWRYNRLGCEPP